MTVHCGSRILDSMPPQRFVIGLAVTLALAGCAEQSNRSTPERPDLARAVISVVLTGVARASAPQGPSLGAAVATVGSAVTRDSAPVSTTAPQAPDRTGGRGQTPFGVLDLSSVPHNAAETPIEDNLDNGAPLTALGQPRTLASTVAAAAARATEAAQPETSAAAPVAPANDTETAQSETVQSSEEPAQDEYEQYTEPDVQAPQEQARFPGDSGVDTLGPQEATTEIVVPGVGVFRPLTLRQESLAAPAYARVGTPEQSRGVAGFTGAGAGEGFTGVSAGSGFTGVGAGRGFTGVGAGSGFTGVGAGEGFTGVGAGQGFTGLGAGEGFTGLAAGVSPYIAGPGGLTPVQGFGQIRSSTQR
jgi:hypothetical protein